MRILEEDGEQANQHQTIQQDQGYSHQAIAKSIFDGHHGDQRRARVRSCLCNVCFFAKNINTKIEDAQKVVNAEEGRNLLKANVDKQKGLH